MLTLHGVTGNVQYSPELEPYPKALCDAVVHAVPGWLTTRITALVEGVSTDDRDKVLSALDDIVERTQRSVRHDLYGLLLQDVDEQRQNPLQVLRNSIKYATDVLNSCGIPHVVRDEFDVKAMPDDVYALGPLTWKDLSEEVHEAGINWGAWKAATVLQRRRAEGKIS
ncbi:MAG: hypothetical protein RIR69_289 [Actinomycetota bacterium]